MAVGERSRQMARSHSARSSRFTKLRRQNWPLREVGLSIILARQRLSPSALNPMKPLLHIFFAIIASHQAHGQGTVLFNNLVPSAGVNAPIYGVDQVTRIAGTAYLAQLYAGSPNSSLAPIGSAVNFGIGSDAGYFDQSLNLTRALGFAPAGGDVWVKVRAWSVDGGSTYEEAAIHFGASIGQSTISGMK